MILYRLLYRSEMDLSGTEADVRQQVSAIVRQAAERNAGLGVTGGLLQTRGVFIQALEGPLPELEATFERICCDLRHRRVELLEFAQADRRAFDEWSMVGITADRTIERLFHTSISFHEPTHETMSAQAVVQLMRTLLMTGATVAGESNQGYAPQQGSS